MIARARTLLAVLALALIPAGIAAQETGTVTGRVVDQGTQQPLSGVQIFIAGSSRGTLTNQQGRFLIPNVAAGSQTVRAALIGYSQGEQTVTVPAGGSATAEFSLRPSAVELDAVVVNAVTGQAERKRELGTNTGTISVAEIEKAPITKMADVLTGRTPGLNLQGVSGTTGTSQKIRIRGANSLSLSNEPLIYVDGVQFSNSTGGIGTGGQNFSRLNDLNPEDIQSIEVLKGPAASALYGTAAANGVLLITTKRGREGSTVWRGYAEAGVLEDVNDYPSSFLAFQVNDPNAERATASGRLNTAGGAFTPCPNESAARGVCRQDEVASINPFRTEPFSPFETGNRQKYGLSASGGGEVVNFYLSGDVENEQGVISFNTIDKVNLRANLGARLLENLDMQVSSAYIKSNLALNSNDNSIFSPLINAGLASPFAPTPEQLAASRPGGRPGFGFGFDINDIENIITNQEVDRFIIGTTGSYRPLPWLAANANVGLDFFSREDFRTIQPGRLAIGSPFTEGFRDARRASNYVYTGNGSTTATFEPTSDLTSTSTLGVSYNRQLFENTQCFGAGIVEGTRSCGAASSLFEVDEDFSEIITIGGFFQQQFGWRDRVFLAGSIRGDDNSAFGQDFGFIYYPSASLSWVVSEEGFFPRSDMLSNLRLRTAIGTSGLRPNFRDATTLFAPVSVTVDAGETSAIRLRSVGNTELEPERTTEYELGFDAGLFRDRLSVDFTYFNKESRDALISRRLAPSFGLTGDDPNSGSVFQNLGQIRNSGTEVGVTALVVDRPEARFNMRLSATTIENEIEELGEGVSTISFNRGTQRFQEGFSAGAYFGRTFTFNDADGNGLLSRDEVTFTSDTAVFLGPSLPTNTQSLAADLTLFRYVTLSSLFERRAGNKQLNDTERFRCTTGFNRQTRGTCNAVGNPEASLEEQARFIAERFMGTRTGFIEDADFIKWREASITLGVPPQLSRAFRYLEGASLTLSGRNLKTWTDYTGIDPEINETGSQSFNTGGDFLQGEFNTQPPVRYFTARLNFTF
jgi:TonB-linked SusC/RagA family outer membrane protein